jgi:uncharacterized membrane protein YgdD (TMEM256/DUF423 family)
MIPMSYRWLTALGAANGALVVALGAYGAHAVNDPANIALMQTAVQYHMFHTLALLVVGIAAMTRRPSALWWWTGGMFLAGILLFSGGLYVMAMTGYRGVAALTPIGGVAFIAAWFLFALAWLRSR